jgi:hypothetical protein
LRNVKINNSLGRINYDVLRRTRVFESIADANLALMHVAERLRHMHQKMRLRKYTDIERPYAVEWN